MDNEPLSLEAALRDYRELTANYSAEQLLDLRWEIWDNNAQLINASYEQD